VWTIHNVVPHEPQTADDQTLSRYLAAIADGKIVHSPYTLAQMEAIGMDTANTTVIPHGNYDGSYPDGISRAAARKQLGLQKNDFAILFFGKIRQYKGVEGLLAAFQALQLPHTRLIIAGQNDTVESDAAIRAASQHAAISYYPGHVADADVATYFKACDIVCLPFTSITTSGSVLLALTFGKPLIAPQTGALTDIPAAAGYIYDPALPGALQQTLHTAIVQHHTLLTKGKAARAYADTLSWDKLATKTYDFYVRLLERK
jgi:glycosyltransferase involved in cell wall biosynthesis